MLGQPLGRPFEGPTRSVPTDARWAHEPPQAPAGIPSKITWRIDVATSSMRSDASRVVQTDRAAHSDRCQRAM
jgi:hypothetical protein